MTVTMSNYTVRAAACDHRSDDEAVYQKLREAVAPLDRSWERLKQADKIAVKFNQDFNRSRMFAGQRRELVSDSVARAVLKILREDTDAELVCVDASWFRIHQQTDTRETTQIASILDEFGVRYLDCTAPPFVGCSVPGGGAMFGIYEFAEELIEADELVSVAKMKNHGFMGVTGCLKNLFGLVPAEFRPRHYYHHLVRMPYMLADIGRILDPALSVVDGMVAQPGGEWREEACDGVIADTVLAGDHAVATDSCMAYLMGHDPEADWLIDPFIRDRNCLEVAREYEFGTNRLKDFDFEHEPEPASEGTFYCQVDDPIDTIIAWRRSMCEQALYYRDHLEQFLPYRDQFVMIQRGEVKWHSPDGSIDTSRRLIAGDHVKESLFLKFVDPEQHEDEQYDVYERALGDIERRNL